MAKDRIIFTNSTDDMRIRIDKHNNVIFDKFHGKNINNEEIWLNCKQINSSWIRTIKEYVLSKECIQATKIEC